MTIILPKTQDKAFLLLPENHKRMVTSGAGAHAKLYATVHPPSLAMLEKAVWLSASESKHINILIIGPTGTGKELVAEVLHGGETDGELGNMVSINCSGVTETLFESIIFGHARGAYTGASKDGLGLLRQANTGTAFFDEVGDLPLAQQAKLLRVLQSREATPVGDTIPYKVTCRFVFATHKELKNLVALGQFREDLYYRISTVVLRTFHLSQRREDVSVIAATIAGRKGYDGSCLDDLPVDFLAQCPGGVRAIENYLARRVLLDYTPDEAIVDL